MSLQIYLPLNGDLNNYGLTNMTFINTATNILVDNNGRVGKCYTRAAKAAGRIISNETINLNGDLTMCCWAKVTATVGDTANGLITNHCYTTNTGFGITVKQVSTSDYRISCSTGDGSSRTYYTYYGTTNIKNAWHHLALTYDSTNHQFKLWVDGICEVTQDYTNASADSKIGIFNWGLEIETAKYHPACSIDEVRIYDNVLKESELLRLASNRGNKSLVAWFPLNATLTNLGINKDITLTNSNATTANTGKTNKSYTFNGTNALMASNYGNGESIRNKTFTIWVKPNNTDHKMFVCAANGTNQRFYIGINNETYDIGYGSQPWSRTTSAPAVVGEWAHLAVTIDNDGKATLYYNGNYVLQLTEANDFNLASDISIGGRASDYYTNCSLNDFRIYQRCLQPSEIKRLSMARIGHYLCNCLPLSNDDKAFYDGVYGSKSTSNVTSASCKFAGSPRYAYCWNNAASRYIKLPANPYSYATQNFSFCLWAYAADWTTTATWGTADGPAILSSVQSSKGWGIRLNGTRATDGVQLKIYIYRNGSWQNAGIDLSTITSGWHHIAGTTDGFVTNMYMDGVLVDSTTAAASRGAIIQGNTPFIGYESGGSSVTSKGQFKGKVSDVEFYANCLTLEDIQSIYHKGHIPTT